VDSKKRSFLKAVTWKILGFMILPFVAVLTFRGAEAGSFIVEADSFVLLSVVYHITMFTLFFAHERVWNKIKWEKKE
tara:strand:- start:9062 stop:9292 length:231 start_codon:yes stop_codon:yes gene_type:complete